MASTTSNKRKAVETLEDLPSKKIKQGRAVDICSAGSTSVDTVEKEASGSSAPGGTAVTRDAPRKLAAPSQHRLERSRMPTRSAAQIAADDDAIIARLELVRRDRLYPHESFAGRTYQNLKRCEDEKVEMIKVNLELLKKLAAAEESEKKAQAELEQHKIQAADELKQHKIQAANELKKANELKWEQVDKVTELTTVNGRKVESMNIQKREDKAEIVRLKAALAKSQEETSTAESEMRTLRKANEDAIAVATNKLQDENAKVGEQAITAILSLEEKLKVSMALGLIARFKLRSEVRRVSRVSEEADEYIVHAAYIIDDRDDEIAQLKEEVLTRCLPSSNPVEDLQNKANAAEKDSTSCEEDEHLDLSSDIDSDLLAEESDDMEQGEDVGEIALLDDSGLGASIVSEEAPESGYNFLGAAERVMDTGPDKCSNADDSTEIRPDEPRSSPVSILEQALDAIINERRPNHDVDAETEDGRLPPMTPSGPALQRHPARGSDRTPRDVPTGPSRNLRLHSSEGIQRPGRNGSQGGRSSTAAPPTGPRNLRVAGRLDSRPTAHGSSRDPRLSMGASNANTRIQRQSGAPSAPYDDTYAQARAEAARAREARNHANTERRHGMR